MELYTQAMQNGGTKTLAVSGRAKPAGPGSNAELAKSKMTPAERKKEIARRKAEAQKEKVRFSAWRTELFFAGAFLRQSDAFEGQSWAVSTHAARVSCTRLAASTACGVRLFDLRS